VLFAGTFIVGVAVGADVPTSLALVGEFAPDKARGKLLGLTQVAWCLGPSVVLWMAMAVAPLGYWGVRLLFLHLFAVAVVTWAMRRGLAESARWRAASATGKEQVKALFTPANTAGDALDRHDLPFLEPHRRHQRSVLSLFQQYPARRRPGGRRQDAGGEHGAREPVVPLHDARHGVHLHAELRPELPRPAGGCGVPARSSRSPPGGC
jgi:hypothetical protein